MAKFCGKCGMKLDEDTGLCPNCDAVKIEDSSAQEKTKLTPEQRQEAVRASEESLSQKDAKKKRKADKKTDKKAKKKEKQEQWSAWKKIRRFILKIILIVFLLLLLMTGIIGALVYFEIVDVAEVSYILTRSGIQKEKNVVLDPMKDNYIPNEDSVFYDEKRNQFYANNEIIVIFSNDTTESQKKDVIVFLDGELVGTVPELNMYQIIIQNCNELEELINITNEIMEKFDFVVYATYDSVTINQNDVCVPNDPWGGDVKKGDWRDNTIDGSNWWAEAINVQSAWDYNDNFSNIFIGVCDSSFDIGHEDLKNRVSFPNELLESRNVVMPWWYDFDNLKDIKSWSVSEQENYHGTHVTGIIGAEGENKKGITGIVQNCSILLAPYYRSKNMETYLAWDSSTYANLAYLVKAGAKVVNFSQGKTGFLKENTNNMSYKKDMIEREGNLAAVSLSQLITSGYKDFIVVQSSGNGTGNTEKAVNALQNGWFSSITDESMTGYDNISIQEVRSHVIIVGAAEQTKSGFQCASFSNYGTQVDVCAPGVKIYSTIPGEIFYDFQIFGGYGFDSGTSMAAPIVTGVCALTWSANSNLTASEVKNIVCNNTSIVVRANPKTNDDTTYNMVDAKLSVEAALGYYENINKGQSDQSCPTRTTSDERDIVLVLDTSGSMSGTPMDETKKASVNFIDTILDEDASIGIVTYDDGSYALSDFSADKNMLTDAVSNIYDGGGTNIESGLAKAHEMLSTSSAKKKIIVLMSDGEPNEGKEGDALIDYADEIKNDDIMIYTLGFFESLGSDKSSAQLLMEEIASDGCHYEVADADDLVFFFEDMADQINGQKYIYIRIACPVDVTVTYNGETLCSAEDDLNLRTDFGTLTFEENENVADADEDDRIKVLRLKEGMDYDVQIVGTGHGIMDYTIGFMDENGDYNDFRRFEDIKITRRTTIDTVAAVSKESILNIDENGDGKYDLRLRAKENGYGEEVEESVLIYIIVGVSVLLLIVLICFEVCKRTKTFGGEKENRLFCNNCGNQFLGNTKFCSKCGVEIKRDSLSKKKGFWGVRYKRIKFVVLLGIACVLVSMLKKEVESNYDNNMQNERLSLQQTEYYSQEEYIDDTEDEQIEENIVENTQRKIIEDKNVANSSNMVIEQEFDDDIIQDERSMNNLEIDVEDTIIQIRNWYAETQNNIASLSCNIMNDDVKGFYDEDGNIVKILAFKGYDSLDFAREYYFNEGELYFAFIYDGVEEQRLYFNDGQLIRYIDKDGNIFDTNDAIAFTSFAEELKTDMKELKTKLAD